MATELVSIATDTHPLDGLLYTVTQSRGAVLWLHGHGMNFYTGMPRFGPAKFAARGYSSLAFNRRGHDILHIRDSREAYGAAIHSMAQAVADVDYAARWLKAQCLGPLIIVGHSIGGTLGVRHAAQADDIRALVLLSAHAGRSQLPNTGALVGAAGQELLKRAHELCDVGRGDELLVLPSFWYVSSARTLVDRIENSPDMLELAPHVHCPSLFLLGADEPEVLYPARAYQQRCTSPCDVHFLQDCDHFYNGQEQAACDIILQWLDRSLQ